MPNVLTSRRIVRQIVTSDFIHDPTVRWGYQTHFDRLPVTQADLDFDPATTPTAAEMRLCRLAHDAFKLDGTNIASSNSSFFSSGGVTVGTATGSADQAVLAPATVNSGNTNVNCLGAMTFPSGKAPWFECIISLQSVASCIFTAGLKLTNDPDYTTDNDQVAWNFDASASAKWRNVSSVGGTDTVGTLTGLASVVADTFYRLGIKVDPSTRVPYFFLNGKQVASGTALTDATSLKPFVGIETSTTAQKTFRIRHLRVSRLY